MSAYRRIRPITLRSVIHAILYGRGIGFAVTIGGILVVAAAIFMASLVAAAAPAQGAAAGFRHAIALREGPAGLSGPAVSLGFAAPERLRIDAPPPPIAAPGRGLKPGIVPKIVIVIDDLGLNAATLDEVLALPGPLTLSFLPYGEGLAEQTRRASDAGHTVMLHLPMEPRGAADPGPDALTTTMSAEEINTIVEQTLLRSDRFEGVNNHMGSRFTRDRDRMRVVMDGLKERNLFFLDSMTTRGSAGGKAARAAGISFFARDVFLDPDADGETVRRQLAKAEEIARATGLAIAICHPRAATLEALGPWLATAPARGFDLSTMRELRAAAAVKA